MRYRQDSGSLRRWSLTSLYLSGETGQENSPDQLERGLSPLGDCEEIQPDLQLTGD